VVGVAPAGFFGASWGTALTGFVPATMLTQLRENGQYYALKRGNTAVFLVGRLKRGVALAQARAAVDVAFGRVMQANPGYYPREARAVVMRERDSRPSPYIAHKTPRIVAALSALALLVLAVAAANAANLLYARAASRERELAIRAAVGASRTQIIRSLLAESTLLALAAGVVGSVASLVLTPALLGMILPSSGNTPPPADTGIDWRPFLVAGLASFAVGFVAGLIPALKASGVAPLAFMRETPSSTDSRRHPWRSLLVAGQVAVSCVVLVCASLTLRSMVLLLRTDLGFQVRNVMVASFDLGRQNYNPTRGREFHARLLEKVRALPGVEAASLVTAAPLDSGINQLGGITAADAPAPAGNLPHSIAYVLGEHTCLSTLGLRIEAGRDFSARDGFGAPRVAVVNRALAEHLWPGLDPVGRQVSIQGNKAEVIGVVGRSRYYNITDDSRPLLFDSLAQNYRGAVTLVVRHAGPVEPLTAAIPAIVRELDPDLPLYGVRSLLEQIMASASGLMPYRTGAILAAAQGAIALILAGAGVFGLIAFAVARRTREIGIRMALGASWLDVVRAVTRESIVLTVAGLAIGLAVSFALSRTLSGLLYGAGTLDAVVFGGVGLLVLVTAALACWLPARRAARVDPLVTLRAE
jgi:predicted permease